jgi:OmpA-OmpF porin, OOP family
MHCGSPLDLGAKFCRNCGAQRSPSSPPDPAPGQVPTVVSPSSSTQGGGSSSPSAAGPLVGAKAGGPLLKVILVVAGFVVFLGLLGMGSCAYFVYRAKKKVEAIEHSSRYRVPARGVDGASRSGSNPSLASPKRPTPTFVQVTGPETERTVGGSEADLVVRTGDLNNLGFGFPKGFDPFSGDSTPPHAYPWSPPPESPAGTDRIMMGSGVTASDIAGHAHDGYSVTTVREDTMPQPISIAIGALPESVDAVLIQMFVDDFQAPVFHSHFQATLNGTRIPSLEVVLNALEQTGPIGKLVSIRLLPEYWPLLKAGTVNLLIDDPTTHVGDGFAIDFVRILVNPHSSKYQVSLNASVTDADKDTPIPGATVDAALVSTKTDDRGHSELQGLPAGLVVASASAPGYDGASVSVDLVAGQTGNAEFKLHRHDEGTAALERSIAQTGSATLYGIHFDSDSAKLRPDSAPALASILGLLNDHPASRWTIAGHTDDQGLAERNLPLSEARAAAVVSWLTARGVEGARLVPQGFGANRPVADNKTVDGRALNRRVEIAPAP